MMGLLDIVEILPFHSLLSHGGSPEKNIGVFKKAGPARPQPLGRAERTEEYVSTA